MAEKQLIDGAWYWVRFETGFKDEWTQAPAMYRSGGDAWYSFLFAGIPARKVEVLGKIDAPAPAICSCPSGDGSLRWPCAVHPAPAPAEPAASATQAGAANPATPVVLPEPVAWLIERSAFRVSPHGQDAESNEWLEEAHEPGEEGSFQVYTEQQVHTLLASLALPAPAAMAVPDERQAFEDWWRKNVAPGLCGIESDYRFWAIWQARAALAATPAAKAEVQADPVAWDGKLPGSLQRALVATNDA